MNLRKSFDTWRLTNLKDATDSELEESESACEYLAVRSAWLVIFGLVLEVIEALLFFKSHPFIERWGAVVADTLVAVGVIGEVYFSVKGAKYSSELRRRSDIKLAEATDKASVANQKVEEAQLARVKLEGQLAPRLLTKEQYEVFQALKGEISEVNITPISAYEAARFASQIAQALGDAGIKVRLFPPRLALLWPDIYVVIPKPVEDFSKEPLYVAFKNAGMSVGCGDRSKNPMIDFPPDVPIIMVGEKKGLSYPEIPYAFNFSTKNVTHVGSEG